MTMKWNGYTKTNSRLYKIWFGIVDRCTNEDCAQFQNYGARGIRVCNDWLSFHSFLEWAIGAGDHRGKSIDRIDNDGHYEPSNCRWATAKQQARNRSSTNRYEYMGGKFCIPEIADLCGVPVATLRYRIIVCGETASEAASRPARKAIRIAEKGDATITEVANTNGIDRDLVYLRLKRGASIDRALSVRMPPKERPQKTISIGGAEHTIRDWCKIIGISEATFHKRRRTGANVLAPRGPTGPKAHTIYRSKPGPAPSKAQPA